nr:hypothetical protein [Erythrobacter sp. CCH5-A1]
MQDAVPALAVADDGVRAPLPAAGRGDAFSVQALRDRGRALARGIVSEDAADDRRLVFVDFPKPAFGLAIGGEGEDLAIAIGQPARDAPSADPADMAAPDLVGQLFEKQRRHRPAQPDMHRPDFAF